MKKVDSMNILDIIENIKIKTIYGSLPTKVNNISQDSRKITKGDVFVAIKGYTVDGHNYIEKVIAQGAALVIASRYEDYNVQDCAVVVVKEHEIEKIASMLAKNKFREQGSYCCSNRNEWENEYFNISTQYVT